MIRILYFARLREQLGAGEEEIAPGKELRTAGDILASLRRRGGPWSDALDERENILCAVNHDMAGLDSTVEDGDEVAFFPPVTGG